MSWTIFLLCRAIIHCFTVVKLSMLPLQGRAVMRSAHDHSQIAL